MDRIIQHGSANSTVICTSKEGWTEVLDEKGIVSLSSDEKEDVSKVKTRLITAQVLRKLMSSLSSQLEIAVCDHLQAKRSFTRSSVVRESVQWKTRRNPSVTSENVSRTKKVATRKLEKVD